MTQEERNFGTKALRRDGVRIDTKGGRALYGVSVGYDQACEAAYYCTVLLTVSVTAVIAAQTVLYSSFTVLV